MAFLSSLDISASGMTAQRQRFDIISENITNMTTTRTEDGGPYRRKMVVFEPIKTSPFQQQLSYAMGRQNGNTPGVRVAEIVEDQRPFKPVYNPEHPDANEEGYVMMPNIDLLKETADAMSASRSYEANITAFNAVKLMASKALEIGRAGQ